MPVIAPRIITLYKTKEMILNDIKEAKRDHPTALGLLRKQEYRSNTNYEND